MQHHNPQQENPTHSNLILSVFRSLQDTDSLFDFETPITQDVFVANGPTQIFRKKDVDPHLRRAKVVGKRQAMNGEMPGFDFQAFLNITTKKTTNGTRYLLSSSHPYQPSRLQHAEGLDQLPFICLNKHGRTSGLTSHPIVKDDIIKLGKTCFRVSETHHTRGNRGDAPFGSQDASFSPIDRPEGLVCRICLSDGGEDLISPCDCRGSCQFVHFSCLQTWIQCKVRKQENRIVSIYSLARLECELCKKSLPNHMRIGGESHNLVEFQWPREPFIVLERLPSSQQETARTFMVLKPGQRELRIGRWPGMDLRVPDITLSRVHSSISFVNSSFLLRDEGSRFGSLILLRSPVEVDKLMCLQAGSKLYKVEPHKPQRNHLRIP